MFFILSVNSESFYAHGIDEKAIFFGRSFDISSNNDSSEPPQISSQGNNVYVVWQDNSSGNNDIYFRQSATNSTGFKSIPNLSNSSGNSQIPQTIVCGAKVFVVWQDDTDRNYCVYFKRSPNNGTGFQVSLSSTSMALQNNL